MTEIHYFGYGANRNPDMMKAIVGRKPKGYSAALEGFELCIQSWGNIPKNVQKLLAPAWGPGFKSYCVRPTRDKVVRGKVWILNEAERKLIDAWELTDYWYRPVVVHFNEPNNKSVQVEIQIVDNVEIDKLVDGTKYPTWLNDKNKMIDVAQGVRERSI
jgi:hypothetical protein